MVDAAALFDGEASTPGSADLPSATAGFAASVSRDGAGYAAFCANVRHAPPQGAAWIETWTATTAPDTLFAALSRDGKTQLMLALEVATWRGCRIARFMGDRHANGNFPACRARVEPAAFSLLAQAIRAARPDIDLVALERLAPELDGMANPLLAMPSFASPNLALSVDLRGGFDALLARASGKRKRKKYRSQMRKFEAAGGARRIEAITASDTDRLLDAFFAMKTLRFQKAGIRNVFADAAVQAFFRRLFAEALGARPPAFVLHGLEVGGKLRAITGSSRSGSRITCEFGAILEDDAANTSPGDFLFFDNIREACEQGLAVYDFGVGDEPYKRLWCDIETQHRDVLLPLTLKGRLLAQALRAFASLKARIKNSPVAWRFAKRMRRRTAGTQPADEGEE